MASPHRPFTLIRGLLWIMLVGNAVAIVGIVLQFDGPATRRFEVAPSLLLATQPSTELRIQAVSVTVQDPTVAQTLLDLLASPLPVVLATLPMILYAMRILDRVAAQPFTASTAAALRRLGLIVAIAGAASELLRTVGLVALESTVAPLPERMAVLDLTAAGWWVILGLLLLAFAQIIAYGHRLRTELDQVI